MTYECRTKTVLFTMEVKKERSELWKQKNILIWKQKNIFFLQLGNESAFVRMKRTEDVLSLNNPSTQVGNKWV